LSTGGLAWVLLVTVLLNPGNADALLLLLLNTLLGFVAFPVVFGGRAGGIALGKGSKRFTGFGGITGDTLSSEDVLLYVVFGMFGNGYKIDYSEIIRRKNDTLLVDTGVLKKPKGSARAAVLFGGNTGGEEFLTLNAAVTLSEGVGATKGSINRLILLLVTTCYRNYCLE
jgi:hypothetical protein